METVSLITFMVLTYLLCSFQFSKIVCFLGEYRTKNKFIKEVIAGCQHQCCDSRATNGSYF